MRATQDLRKLSDAAAYRLRRLQACMLEAAGRTGLDRDRVVGHVVLESQSLWGNFVRAYLLSCLFRPRRRNGGIVTLGNQAVQNPVDILLAAARASRGPYANPPTSRRDEPAWHDVQILLRTCQAIDCSHLSSVQAAVSTQVTVFSHLPAFRNFYAHRNEETFDSALRVAKTHFLLTAAKHPTEALCTRPRNRPQPLLLDWLDEMTVVVDFLCD
jgi:hypothetical protein